MLSSVQGFGGLAAAIRLQAKGMHVTLLEKNAEVGGHASQLVKDGYTFDMGPSIITAPDLIQRVFECAGARMEDYLDVVKLDPFYRIYFHDRTSLDYTDDSGQMKRQMARSRSARQTLRIMTVLWRIRVSYTML